MVTLDLTFSALADPTRRAILARLARGGATVGELAQPFQISGPAISRHLRVLERAELITSKREGQHRRCQIAPIAMTGAAEWIESYRNFWNSSFDKLDEQLKQTKGTPDGANG